MTAAEFHADGRRIFKSPVKKREGKQTVITIGFPLCEVYEHVQNAEVVAKATAEALSQSETFS